MAEITLQQIADLMDQKLAAQTDFMRQELAAQEARMDQKFDAQTEQFASLEARMDQKFAAQEARITELKTHVDQRLADVLDGVKETVHTAVLEIGEQLSETENRMKVLLEEFEHEKVRSLFEENDSNKKKTANHERRIKTLEAAGN